ncbi:MAG: 30S ribosomal protein S16, partial [Cyclobacteriaceae bacterium]
MAVKIRLARRGRKKLALYDVIVADARAPRDGKFIEKIGTYNPATNPASINLDETRAFDWLMKGAQ